MSRNVCLGQTKASAALVGSETDKACPQVCNGYLLDKRRKHHGFETLLEETVHSQRKHDQVSSIYSAAKACSYHVPARLRLMLQSGLVLDYYMYIRQSAALLISLSASGERITALSIRVCCSYHRRGHAGLEDCNTSRIGQSTDGQTHAGLATA